MADEFNQIRGILSANREQLLKRLNVVATGIGYKETGGTKTSTLCIVCSVKKKVKANQLSAQDLVPTAVAGMPTDVVETGVIRVFQARRSQRRPCSHHSRNAGVLGN
jgi:hypothetical protein